MRTEFNRKVGKDMTHTPYGYRIENGIAVVDGVDAERIKALYQEYIDCKSMRASAKKAGIDKTHSVIGRILKNKVYLGTVYYPQIIDDDIFAKAQEIREHNVRSQNRIGIYRPHPKAEIGVFKIRTIEEKYKDPYKQAEYAYGQIVEVANE